VAKASAKDRGEAPAAQKAKKPTTAARYHVVKPQETLYRVALQNGITVAELRKLNKMRPDDNKIRRGRSSRSAFKPRSEGHDRVGVNPRGANQ
jgi:membrane-bound lytic murein transglycosylase D